MILPTVSGGMIVCRPRRRMIKDYDTPLHWYLQSDIHLGAPNVQYKLIHEELEECAKNDGRLAINGDVFDGILPSDHKRYTVDAVHPKFAFRMDIMNAVIDYAVELYGPYAQFIDMIGEGNHDTAIKKYHGLDPVAILIDRLQQKVPKKLGHYIHHGGYGGFLDYRIGAPRTASAWRLVINYFHGSGGDSPVTKGMIDAHRRMWVDCDIMWIGHKHNRWNGDVRRISCPKSGEQPVVEEVRQIMTGAYFVTYGGQSQKSIKDGGRRTLWAADRGFAPQGIGGATVTVKFHKTEPKKITVTQ